MVPGLSLRAARFAMLALLMALSGPSSGARVARVGVIFMAATVQEARESPITRKATDGLVEGLRELGWTEGRNLEIHWRSAEGHRERVPRIIGELMKIPVDILVVNGTYAAQKVLEVSRTLPVVMINAGDPVEAGVVASLARPGGSVTGLVQAMDDSIWGKQAEILKQAVPRLKRIAILTTPGLDGDAGEALARVASQASSLDLAVFQVRAETPGELEGAFSDAVRQRADAVWIASSLGFVAASQMIMHGLAIKHRIPVMHSAPSAVERGGLMTYALDHRAQYSRVAGYVDKILRGARAGNLPVEQPVKYELLINLKAAKAIGLTIPPSLLQRADRVFE